LLAQWGSKLSSTVTQSRDRDDYAVEDVLNQQPS